MELGITHPMRLAARSFTLNNILLHGGVNNNSTETSPYQLANRCSRAFALASSLRIGVFIGQLIIRVALAFESL